MSIEKNNKRFFDLLLENQIIEKINDEEFKMHPLFQPILTSCLESNMSLVHGIMNAVHSYLPEKSRLEQAVICNFLADFIKDGSSLLGKELQTELNVFKAQNPEMEINDKNRHLESFDSVMEAIAKDKELK